MQYRPLGTCGLRVSALSLGTMTFGESTTLMKGLTSHDEVARSVFDACVDRGINFIDTADVYSEGRSEELCGEFAREKRAKLLIATKCRFPIGFGTSSVPDPHERGLSRRHIIDACEASLRRLRTDWIDLYQVHMQDSSVRIDETLRALDDLVTQGKVRYVACSNYSGFRLVESLWAAEKFRTHRFESVQLQWSLLERGAEREVVAACRAFGVGVLVWSPLASGLLTGKYRRDAPPPAGSRLEAWQDTLRRLGTDRTWKTLDAVMSVAAKHGATPSAVSIAWLLARSETSSVILGARSLAQLEENLAALEVTLDQTDLATLDKVSRVDAGYPNQFIDRMERF